MTDTDNIEEQLQRATLQSRDQVDATITDIDYHASAERITVHYRIATGDGGTIDERDEFELPAEDTPAYAFVRLCRSTEIPLPDAPTALIGAVVEVAADDGKWMLQIDDRDGVDTSILDDNLSRSGDRDTGNQSAAADVNLAGQLQRATLRSRDRVDATITDIDYHASADQITVHYRIADGNGGTIDGADQFDLPTENTPTYAFVRLCRSTEIPLPEAPAALVGTVVKATHEDGEWSLQIDEDVDAAGPASDGRQAGGQSASGSDQGTRQNVLAVRTRFKRWASSHSPMLYATYTALILAMPLFAIAAIVDPDLRDGDTSAFTEFVFAVLLLGTSCFVTVVIVWIGQTVLFGLL